MPGRHRIVESRCTVHVEDRSYEAKVYSPPSTPRPWSVVAGFDPYRCAHVIDVYAHEELRGTGDLRVKVFVGDKHQADRHSFKQSRNPLWPDDKVENRIVHRVSGSAPAVCFLIEITAWDLYLDFFHEPFDVEALALDDGTSADAEDRALRRRIEELENGYEHEREELRQRTDLPPQVIRRLEGHAMRIYERKLKKIIGED